MENRKKAIMLLSGFILFVIGMLSLILSLVGIHLLILKPVESFGFFYASIIKLSFIITGLILAFMGSSNNKML
ncbi:MAG: hypothetical protein IPM92_06635 [Saprospiraceae bacterium]|nr:hypothetical protein [Saprospiraceae bacterium]